MTSNTKKYFAKSLFKNLLPIQIATVGVLNISGLFNSLIVGALLGPEQLSVLGFLVPLNCIHAMLGGGIAAGAQTLCGRYIGSGERNKIGETYSTAFVLCVILSLLLTLAYLIFPYQIASLLGASSNALEYTAQYLRGYAISIFFLMFSTIMIPFLQLSNASKIMFVSLITLTTTNVVFAIVSILVFKSNMFGVGLACSLSNIIGSLIIIFYCLSSKCPIHFSLKQFSFKNIKYIFNLGLPNTVKPFCLAIRNWVFNLVAVSCGGIMAVTVITIVGNVGLLIDAITGGVEGSTCMISSIFYGERDKDSLKDIVPVSLRIAIPLQALLYLMVFILAKPITFLFGLEGELSSFSMNAMRIVFLYLIANTFYNAIINVYKGIGRTLFVSFVTIINHIVIPVTFSLVIPKFLGINGLWISYVIPELLCFIGLFIYSSYKHKHIPRKLNEIIYLPVNFNIEDSNRYHSKISNVLDISNVSQDILEFCNKKGLDRQKSYYCALCIEELSVPVLNETEGVKGNVKNREIDILLFYENKGISILMRNNYPPFNPIEWANIHDAVDPIKSIGIRMVSKLAKEINYSAVINLNVFYVRIEC